MLLLNRSIIFFFFFFFKIVLTPNFWLLQYMYISYIILNACSQPQKNKTYLTDNFLVKTNRSTSRKFSCHLARALLSGLWSNSMFHKIFLSLASGILYLVVRKLCYYGSFIHSSCDVFKEMTWALKHCIISFLPLRTSHIELTTVHEPEIRHHKTDFLTIYGWIWINILIAVCYFFPFLDSLHADNSLFLSSEFTRNFTLWWIRFELWEKTVLWLGFKNTFPLK